MNAMGIFFLFIFSIAFIEGYPYAPCSEETNTDFFGNDLNQVYNINSSDACCDACSKSSACNAYAWSGNTPGLVDVCYLKSMAQNRQSRQGFTAGQKNTGQTITYSVDISGNISPFPHYWERCIGSGHAALAKREDYRQYLKQAKTDVGIEMIRFHGLFDDDMHVVTSPSPNTYKFDFTEINQIYDFFISIGIRPIVEFGFMPPVMASGNRTVFYYKGNVTPPKSYVDWGNLIEAAVTNWKNRYGEAEVSKWYFEVWNEPNYPDFWIGTQADYFQLYKAAALAVKKVSPSFRVGGPASAGLGWILDIKNFCNSNKIPLDFISTHNYPGADNDDFVYGILRASSEASPLPMVMTEYSAMLMINGLTNHDSAFGSAFVARIIPAVQGLADVFSYWTFSDVFEEGGLSLHPFRNVYGLMNINGIPKPVYRAFQLMHGMSETRLEMTMSGNSKVYGFATIKSGTPTTIDMIFSNYDAINHPPSSTSVHVDVNLRGKKILKSTIQRIDDTHANAFVSWQKMGSPDPLSQSQISDLMKDSQLIIEMLNVNATGSFDLELPTWGVSLITIQF